MLTPDDFANFMHSDVAKQAEDKLKGSVPKEIVPADFFHVRNYLLLRLLQSNAQRPGAIKNLTTQAIDRAHVNDKGAVVMVSQHMIVHSQVCLSIASNLVGLNILIQ